MISRIGKVVVRGDDQKRAKRFSTGRGYEPRRELPVELPHSPAFFTCADVEATYRKLSARGVRFSSPPQRMHFGWWSLFEDPDGTRYALGQWS
jgi:predicted enzyme related to lactoylglutathione lyase